MKPGFVGMKRVSLTFAGETLTGTVRAIVNEGGWYDHEGNRYRSGLSGAPGVHTFFVPAGKALVKLDKGWWQVHSLDNLNPLD